MSVGEATPTLQIHEDPPPLRAAEGGSIRVGNTRISLDLIVEQYENGMSPEEFVLAYDTLSLPDVYGAIAYYLRHREEVQEYIRVREAEAAKFQAEFEAKHPPLTRAELIARLKAQEQADASAGS